MDIKQALREIRGSFGFLDQDHIDVLSENPEWRDRKLLIRGGNTRRLAKARNVRSVVEMIERDGDYVRDVSIPANDQFWKT